MTTNPPQQNTVERSPVVVVMGHIDHGKSSLLDYIRKSSIVASEAGGITQRVSAYEVEHTTKEGEKKRITFLDTPGHEAFSLMRSRSAAVADVAILVVSAEEGVKAQTMEALEAIKDQKIPYVIALSKIDKPNANIDRAKSSLIEHEIYVEGMGGDIPCIPISSKNGDGVHDLLDLVLLAATLAELIGDPTARGEGVVIEAHREEKRGVAATLIIKNGTVHGGDFIVTGTSFAPTRIMENMAGEKVADASFSSPIVVVGFTELPEVGAAWHTVGSKKEAETETRATAVEQTVTANTTPDTPSEGETRAIIPVIIKADVAGCIDAIKKEFDKIPQDAVEIKIVKTGVGAISEDDIKATGTGGRALAIGFNVAVDAAARERAERAGVAIETFDVIYRIGEWLKDAVKDRTPKKLVEEITGSAKVLKTFSTTRNKHVIGARVEHGELKRGSTVRINRRGEIVGEGEIVGLQHLRSPVPKVEEGSECGVEVEAKIPLAAGDYLESITTVEK